MAVVYATTCDVADFLSIKIDETTTPTKAAVEKLINRVEERIDRRTGHTYGRCKTVTNEYQDVHRIYTFGWGSFSTLKQRELRTDCTGLHLCAGAGDKLEVWNGGTDKFDDRTCEDGFYTILPERGELYLRGLIFSILTKNRIRITYRFGSTTVPLDITDACIKLVSIDIVRASFRMDEIVFGGSAIKKEESMKEWQNDIDRIIRNREEIFAIP